MQTPVLQVTDEGGTHYRVTHMVRHESQAIEILGGPVRRIALKNSKSYDTFEACQTAQFALHQEFMHKALPVGAPCHLPRVKGVYAGKDKGKFFVCYDGYILRKAGFPIAANEVQAQNQPQAFLDEDTEEEARYGQIIAKRTRKVLGKSYKYKGLLETRYADYLKLPQYCIRKRGKQFQFVLTYYKLTKKHVETPYQLDFLLPIGETLNIEIVAKPTIEGRQVVTLTDIEEGSGRRMGM